MSPSHRDFRVAARFSGIYFSKANAKQSQANEASVFLLWFLQLECKVEMLLCLTFPKAAEVQLFTAVSFLLLLTFGGLLTFMDPWMFLNNQ